MQVPLDSVILLNMELRLLGTASTWIHEVARAALGATIYNRSVVKKAAGGSEDPGLYLQGLVCKDVSAF